MEQDDFELITEARALIERPVWDSSDEDALKIMLSLVCDGAAARLGDRL